MGGDQFAGKQQAPGGGVDEQRRATANMGMPVAVADLVADQRVAGGFIRNTQQRFRQDTSAPRLPERRGKTPAADPEPSGAAGGGFLVAQLVG